MRNAIATILVLCWVALLAGCTSPQTRLARALQAQDTATVRQVLRDHPELARQKLDGIPPLSLAIPRGRFRLQSTPELVRLLIHYGADVNAKDGMGETTLHRASRHQQAEVALLMIQHGAKVNARDNCGCTPLHNAACYGNADFVRMLIKHGASVSVRDRLGATPLHKAAESGCAEIGATLLDAGAQVDARDRERRTPLHACCSQEYSDGSAFAAMLIARGSDVNAVDNNHETPLMMAAKADSASVVNVLVNHGAKVGLKDRKGHVALHYALDMPEIAASLLKHGADPNIAMDDGEPPLLSAVISAGNYPDNAGYIGVARMLVTYGADVNARGPKGQTALTSALFYDSDCEPSDLSKEIAPLLVDHGADVSAPGECGRTALEWAFDMRRFSEYRPLIERMIAKSSPRLLAGQSGGQCLLGAYGDKEGFQYLLSKGADVTVIGDYGWTLLHSAAYEGDIHLAQLVTSKGLSINVKDNEGRTALQIARERGKKSMVRWLIRHGAKDSSI